MGISKSKYSMSRPETTNSNTPLAEIYGKDSFDRFGDDLAQKILENLSFEEKFRLRCLSKNWKYCLEVTLSKIQRVSFRSRAHTDAYIPLSLRNLDITFKYCPNVNWIEFWGRTAILLHEKIFKSWPKVTEIIFYDFSNIYPHIIDDLCDKYGPQLKKLHYRGSLADSGNLEAFKNILKSSPGLRSVTDVRFWHDKYWYLLYCGLTVAKLFDGDRVLVNNLNKFYFEFGDRDDRYLPLLVDANKKTLRMIKILVTNACSRGLNCIFDQLSKISGLSAIYLKIKLDQNNEEVFAKRFRQLSKSCRSITKITLNINFLIKDPSVVQLIYDSFELFPNVKRLVLYMAFPYDSGMELIRPPKAPQSLLELDFKVYSSKNRIKDEFFTSLVKQFPKLQAIHCSQTEDINEETLKELSKIWSLRSVEIDSIKVSVSQKKIRDAIKSFRKLNQIGLRWTYGDFTYFYPKEFENRSKLTLKV